jgi:hypothetical protein
MPQDLPPAQGYAPIQWKRNLPARGFAPKTYLAIFGAITVYGWYAAIQGIRERRELKREKVWARLHILPLLVAEEDRATYRRHHADVQREAEIMKDVEGWVPGRSVYNDGKARGSYFSWLD